MDFSDLKQGIPNILPHIFTLLCATLIAFIFPKIFRFWLSLLQARRFASASPIPFITVYWYRESGLFWLFSPLFAPFIENLPFRLGHWIRYKKRDFSWAHKGKLPREDLGSDVFWTAAPGGCLLHVSDADVILQIVSRWKDFPKAEFYYNDLNFFGPNVISAEGSVWQRHRRITGPSFNERNSSLVFQESMTQAKAMLASFTKKGRGTPSAPGEEPIIDDLLFWLKAIALNVLSGAAFNVFMPLNIQSILSPNELDIPGSSPQNQVEKDIDHSTTGDPSSGSHSRSWQYNLNRIMDNFSMLLGFPTWALKHSPWKFMRDLQFAFVDFKVHVYDLIHECFSQINAAQTAGESNSARPSQHKNDLLSNIICATKSDQVLKLEDDEIFGNICIFIIAGHETSASALETALILLATEPSFQQDIQVEIDAIYTTKKPGEELSYDDYPKMRTIMALMLESLRLYPPIINLFKTTDKLQTITYRPQEIQIPPDTTIFLEAVSLHRNPAYFSPDPDSFLPTRWLRDASYVPSANSVNESTAHANLFCPKKGSYIPFGAGFRACLGKKFAQVEFCTIIAVLLREYSIELVDECDGTSWEAKKNETLECLDQRRTTIALRMLGKVKVRFIKRGYERFPPR